VPQALPLFPLGPETGEAFIQPAFYSSFRCIGAACEDTCCEGWAVFVDKTTYHKYQTCSDSELSPKLKRESCAALSLRVRARAQ
jgi:hypothetical protein